MTAPHLTRRLLLGTLTALALGLHSAAQAHTDAYLDTLTTPHGGQLRMAGPVHLELVVDKHAPAKDKTVAVYVTDHAGTPQATAGATGTVTLLADKHKVSITLSPDGDNKLTGHGTYASTPDMKAIVSVTLKGQAPQQARFTPMAAHHADQAHEGHETME